MVEMKDIPNYKGKYAVTKDGKVWSYFSSRWMAQQMDRKGYWKVNLRYRGKVKTHRVHRLVMHTYRGKSDLVVNHMNGIKTDNRIENLEYCTNDQNMCHAVKLRKLGLVHSARSYK